MIRGNRTKHRNLFDPFKGLIIFLVLVLGLGLPSSLDAAGTTFVRVLSPSQLINPGEQFTISIAVEPAAEIAGMQFDLSFDASLVTVDSVQEGGLLMQGGASTYFNPGEIDNGAGTISRVAGVIITPGHTVSTPGTFAIITLTAGTAGGICSLILSNVVIGNIEGQALPVSMVNGVVIINQPPVLNSIGDKTVEEGELLTFTISASDPDGDSLSYSASNLPQGASFSSSTRTFSWTPEAGQAGVYVNVHFEVSDGSLTDSENITITVGSVNQPYEDGDANGDGVINALDITKVERIITGLDAETPGADANQDGNINALDITKVERIIAELD